MLNFKKNKLNGDVGGVGWRQLYEILETICTIFRKKGGTNFDNILIFFFNNHPPIYKVVINVPRVICEIKHIYPDISLYDRICKLLHSAVSIRLSIYLSPAWSRDTGSALAAVSPGRLIFL